KYPFPDASGLDDRHVSRLCADRPAHVLYDLFRSCVRPWPQDKKRIGFRTKFIHPGKQTTQATLTIAPRLLQKAHISILLIYQTLQTLFRHECILVAFWE